MDGLATREAVKAARFTIAETKNGPRAEFALDGAAYAVRYVGDSAQWFVLTARNRELECERADVDATSAEMDAAEAAVLDAHRDWRAEEPVEVES